MVVAQENLSYPRNVIRIGHAFAGRFGMVILRMSN